MQINSYYSVSYEYLETFRKISFEITFFEGSVIIEDHVEKKQFPAILTYRIALYTYRGVKDFYEYNKQMGLIVWYITLYDLQVSLIDIKAYRSSMRDIDIK